MYPGTPVMVVSAKSDGPCKLGAGRALHHQGIGTQKGVPSGTWNCRKATQLAKSWAPVLEKGT